MKFRSGSVVFAILAALMFWGCGAEPPPPSPEAAAAASTGQGGVLGFVFSEFGQIRSPPDEATCPQGFNLNTTDLEAKFGVDLPHDCSDPAAHESPEFLALDGPAVIRGLDLDGTTSTSTAGGACAHDDFKGPAGELGIDHQLWRVVGCLKGWQEGDLIQSNAAAAVKDGSRTILMEVSGVDDRRNDPEVFVQFFSSTEAAPKDTAGEILPGGSLSVHDDPHFHSPRAAGSIVDGVLTTEPVDLYLQVKIQTIDSESYFRDARVRLELLPDGTARGLFGGYWDIASFYDITGGHRLARAAAHFLRFNCHGLYAALHRFADGHPDPATGACTSLSMAHEVTALPAFVIRPEELADTR